MPRWGRREEPRWVQPIGNVLAHVFGLLGIAFLTSTITTAILVVLLTIAAGVAEYRGSDGTSSAVASTIISEQGPSKPGP